MGKIKSPKKKNSQSGEYADGSLWYQREEEFLILGITPAYSERIGDVEDVILPEEGDQFEVGDIILTIQGNQSELELIAPATGSVAEVNPALQQLPGLLNDDPMGEGWIVRFQVEDFDIFTDFIEGDGGFSSRYSEEGALGSSESQAPKEEDETENEEDSEEVDGDSGEDDVQEHGPEEDEPQEKGARRKKAGRASPRASKKIRKR